ncbi:MAG: cobalt transporter CbiM [Chloroflexota bacterium]
MHIPDGILPPLVWGGAMAVSGAITAYSLRKINEEDDPRSAVPKAAMMTAAFFVASSIFFPLPPPLSSAHLILAGTMGVILGWYAFPAIIIGLILQAIVFGHGGITVLGANALIMGVPALLVFGLFQLAKKRLHTGWTPLIFGFLGGFLGVAIAALIFYGFIIGTLPADIDASAEINATLLLIASHIPVAIIEGLFTAFLVNYLRRTRPDMLGVQRPAPVHG